jgi:peptide/nickel transport system substrate-binding protein
MGGKTMRKARRAGALVVMLVGLILLAIAGPASIVRADDKPLVVLLNDEPVSLDPMFTQSDAHMILTIHEGLFRLDNDGKIVPAIAESITNVDPLNWNVKLKQGLVFQNGEPINADAVVFTFDRAKKLFAAGQGDLTFAMGALAFDKVEKIDDSTVRIHSAAEILFGTQSRAGRLRAGGRWGLQIRVVQGRRRSRSDRVRQVPPG